MLKDFFTTLGRIYSFIVSVVVAVVLGVMTWGAWSYYEEVQLENEFVEKGQLMTLKVIQTEQKQKSWRDILSNCTYLTVNYRGNDYQTRFVMDSGYVGTGDQVKLLYHPDYNAFRQPASVIHFRQSTLRSRLLEWTTIATFSDEHKLLLLCLILSTASFFLITGVLVTILPVTFLQDIARLILVIELAIAALFFSYDTWKYYEYYQQLKSKGHQVSVNVLDTDRVSHSRSSRHNWHNYTYEATIQYEKQKRIIPISEDDYDRLKPGNTLQAYYDESMNDFMSVDFPPDYARVFIPLFFGLLVYLFFKKDAFRKKQPTLS